jgi:type II secretory pathway component PulF
MIDLAITTGIVGLLVLSTALALRLRRLLWPFEDDGRAYTLRIIPTVVWLVLLFVALFVIMVSFAWVAGLVLWVVTLLIVPVIGARFRQTETRALVWNLALAAEKGIPLSIAARAFAAERKGDVGRRALRLAVALEQGQPLDTAIIRSGLNLPSDLSVSLRFGTASASLHPSLKAATSNAAALDSALQSTFGQIIYLMACVLFTAGTMVFFVVRVLPIFTKILSGYKMQPTWPIVVLMRQHDVLIGSCVFVFLVLVAMAARYVGLFHWDPPLIRRIWRQLHQATILRSLAAAVRQNQELSSTLGMLANSYPKRYIRQQLSQVANCALGGGKWYDCLLRFKLLDAPDAAVLRSAERTGNLAWAIDQTADRLVRRFVTRMNVITSIAFPIATILIASAVVLLAMSVFTSLVKMIGGLA